MKCRIKRLQFESMDQNHLHNNFNIVKFPDDDGGEPTLKVTYSDAIITLGEPHDADLTSLYSKLVSSSQSSEVMSSACTDSQILRDTLAQMFNSFTQIDPSSSSSGNSVHGGEESMRCTLPLSMQLSLSISDEPFWTRRNKWVIAMLLLWLVLLFISIVVLLWSLCIEQYIIIVHNNYFCYGYY